MQTGFDTEKYLKVQTKAILDRVDKFNRLYLEFGGKLCYDFHAARVLPGYDPNTKIKVLQELEDVEVIFCISAKDIQKGRIRGDFGLTYDISALKTINDLRGFGLDVSAVVINRFGDELAAVKFKKYLENLKIKVYVQPEIQGYPADINRIVSANGYGRNPYIKTKKSIVVVTGAGPGSGKMSTCLSQLYYDYNNNIDSDFAKFETFPIWNLPIDHPVNVAYEAATADISDVNMVDPFHLKAYSIVAINYNRDIENFSIMKKIIDKIVNESKDKKIVYNSPTDMCVNNTKEGIVDDAIVREAAKQELIRRYFRYKKEVFLGIEKQETVRKLEKLMQKLSVKVEDRKVVMKAREAAIGARKSGKGNKGVFCGASIELADGSIITGKNSPLLHAESAAVLNAIKELAKIRDDINLLPRHIIENINKLKKNVVRSAVSLDVEEIMITLAISASANPMAELCIGKLAELRNAEMHVTHLLSKGDEAGLRKLGLNVTTDAQSTREIYFKT